MLHDTGVAATPGIDFADLSLGMVMLHLFTFDPAWIRRRPVNRSTCWNGVCSGASRSSCGS